MSLLPIPRAEKSKRLTCPASWTRSAKAIDRFKPLPHDPDENPIFNALLQDWAEHADHARRLASLVQAGQGDAAVALYDGAARLSFEAARNKNRQLVDISNAKAEHARDRTAQAFANAERWISELILGTGVLFAALAAYLWWSVSRPLFELAGLMRRLALYDTDFSIRFESRRDEIGEVARALAVFRRNTIELLESRKRLSSQAEILARSLDKERALATEQRNFISTMSHEFRTPLMAIDGHAQRLIATKERAKPAEIADRAEKIRAGVFRMTSSCRQPGAMRWSSRVGICGRACVRSTSRRCSKALSATTPKLGSAEGCEARFGQIPDGDRRSGAALSSLQQPRFECVQILAGSEYGDPRRERA